MSFPKIVHQKGSFGQIRKNPLFRFCRPILDIFGLTLLNNRVVRSAMQYNFIMSGIIIHQIFSLAHDWFKEARKGF